VITWGQTICDHNNQMIKITGPMQSDYNNRWLTLTVITLSNFHCNNTQCFTKKLFEMKSNFLLLVTKILLLVGHLVIAELLFLALKQTNTNKRKEEKRTNLSCRDISIRLYCVSLRYLILGWVRLG